MFGSPSDTEFVNRVPAAGDTSTSGGPWRVLAVIAAGISSFMLWAYLFEIEETAHASGRVIPSQQIQVVQSLEGGIVREIQVQEGDLVDAGFVLMRIDDTNFTSERGRLREQEEALMAEAVRLTAEAEMAPELEFPEALSSRNPLATIAEEQLFQSQRDQLNRDLEILRQKLVQRRIDLVELSTKREKFRAVLAPLVEEMNQTRELVEQGVVPKIELLRLQSRYADLTGDIEVSEASEPGILAAISQVENEIKAAQSTYVLNARQRLARLQLELAVVQEHLRAADDRVFRADLKAPVRGTVNKVHVTTVGAVVQPGAALIEIVPTDDTLLIETRLSPRDVAFVTAGKPASVKVSAYDYLIYGALDGVVDRVSADTLQNADGVEYFRVIVRTERAYLGDGDRVYPITPGMIASVDIQTGRKTVLSYLAKPILRARAEALHER
ncbi:HlyD family type I secretion periplasmic adaptor subunit [Shimia sp. W99]